MNQEQDMPTARLKGPAFKGMRKDDPAMPGQMKGHTRRASLV